MLCNFFWHPHSYWVGSSEEQSSKPGGNNLQSTIITMMIYRRRINDPSLSIKTHTHALYTCCEYCNYSAPASLCMSGPRTADCHSSTFHAQKHPQAHQPHGSHQGGAVNMAILRSRSKSKGEQSTKWGSRKGNSCRSFFPISSWINFLSESFMECIYLWCDFRKWPQLLFSPQHNFPFYQSDE